MENKRILTHGKIWLLACMVSLFSFLFLKIDSNTIPVEQNTVELSKEDLQNEVAESEFIHNDAIKMISVFIYGVLKL